MWRPRGKRGKRIVSCRCTRRITREFRSRSICAILRARIASFRRCFSTGCNAVKIKNNQNRSPTDMMASYAIELGPTRRIEAENAFIGIVGPIGLHGTLQYRREREPCQEASDVSPPGNARSARCREKFGGPL